MKSKILVLTKLAKALEVAQRDFEFTKGHPHVQAWDSSLLQLVRRVVNSFTLR